MHERNAALLARLDTIDAEYSAFQARHHACDAQLGKYRAENNELRQVLAEESEDSGRGNQAEPVSGVV